MLGDDDFPGSGVEPPGCPTVYDDDPNPVIGIILGPDGAPLAEVHARPVVPFGFQPPKEAATPSKTSTPPTAAPSADCKETPCPTAG